MQRNRKKDRKNEIKKTQTHSIPNTGQLPVTTAGQLLELIMLSALN